MTKVRQWLRKVLTGLAAFLLAGLQFMGEHGSMYANGYSYQWTSHGMRVGMEQHEHLARLEGEVTEEQIRSKAQRERPVQKGKAAS